MAEDSYCDQCQTKVESEKDLIDSRDLKLCVFCHNTFLGNLIQYSSQYPNGFKTLAMGIIGAFSILREEIKKQK